MKHSETPQCTFDIPKIEIRTNSLCYRSKIQGSRDFLNVLSDVVNGMIPEVEYARVRDVPERNLKAEESVSLNPIELS